MSAVVEVSLDRDALLAQEQHLSHGGLFVPPLHPTPEQMARVVVKISTPVGLAEVDACVVQILAEVGVGLALEDVKAAHGQLDPLFAAARGGPSTRRDSFRDDDEATRPPAAAARAGRSRRRPTRSAIAFDEEDEHENAATLHAQIQRMSTAEKRNLALHGDRAARLILMKDTNKSIHTFVVQNPKITLDEVRYMAGYRNINPEVLQRIAHNRDWMQNPRIVSALVANPKTAPTLAVRMLEKLSMTEIRRLSRSSDVPRAVVQAARRKVLG